MLRPEKLCKEDDLVARLAALSKERPQVVALCGLPGAGKTTLAEKLAVRFAGRALRVSEDDFCCVPTAQRKSFLLKALAENDLDALRALAKPANPKDNPYANPLSWYDWAALRTCLKTLKAGKPFERSNGWDQKTGRCDRPVLYTQPKNPPPLLLFDTNYPLECKELVDVIVLLDADRNLAETRQMHRDSHRSEETYFAYKKIIDEYYCLPYTEKIRFVADMIIEPSTERKMDY